MIRVLHAVHSLHSGGAERQLRLLATSWNDPGVELGVFFVQGKRSDIDNPGVRLFPSAGSKPASASFLKSLSGAIREFQPDIVHAWLPASVTIPTMIIGALSGARVIFSYRNKMTFHRLLTYPEFLVALLCADRILSNHDIDDSAAPFRWLYRRHGGRTIRNFVEVPAALVRPPTSRLPEAWHFIVVGRLTRQKNYECLINAFSLLHDTPSWSLDIYGAGELQEVVETLIEQRRLIGKVTMRGFHPAVYEPMSRASALVFPSLWEGMPNVLLEALALGVPVIASDIPANRQLVGDAPAVVWVDPQSAQSVAKGLGDLMAGAYDIGKLTSSGLEIASGFSLARAQKAYRYEYMELAGRDSGQ